MMYASKIEIKRYPQEVRFHKEIELPEGLLTLEILSKYLTKDESFSIDSQSERFYSKTILNIYGKRLETPEEVNKRVIKEEKYMEGYYKHHAKYDKK